MLVWIQDSMALVIMKGSSFLDVSSCSPVKINWHLEEHTASFRVEEKAKKRAWRKQEIEHMLVYCNNSTTSFSDIVVTAQCLTVALYQAYILLFLGLCKLHGCHQLVCFSQLILQSS